MCGPTAAETSISGKQQAFDTTLQNSFADRFGMQSNTMQLLNNYLSPIVEAGPGQQGFSPAELAARSTQAIDTVAGNYRNAAQAVGGQLAGRGGGGSSGLVSGVDQQIKASIASEGARALSNSENQITAENYATGRQNFFNATAGENALAGLENPIGFGSEANQGSQIAFGQANEIQNQKNAFAKDVAGFVSTAAKEALAAASGGAGGGGGGGLEYDPNSGGSLSA